MAKGKKTGGRNFVPGVVTNPNGRPRIPEDLIGARKVNRAEVERLLNKFLIMGPLELNEFKRDPKATMLELMIHSIVVKAVNSGDQQRLDFLLNRLIGPVKQQLQVELSNEELAVMVKARLDESRNGKKI